MQLLLIADCCKLVMALKGHARDGSGLRMQLAVDFPGVGRVTS